MPSTPRRLAAAASIALILAPLTARADVPFHKIFPTNAVEVGGQDKFPDWVVVVFPAGPPSGRPIAWPSLVEPGFQTVIDRKTLGTPRLWILPRTALDDLMAAARDNDDQVEGPVADLLKSKGVECVKVDLVKETSVPFTAPEQWLVKYLLEDAAPGRCAMKKVSEDLTNEEFKRGPSWAKFAPRKKKDAGAPAASASAPASASSITPASAVSAPPAAPPPSSAPPASSAKPEPQVPERAKGCACTVGEERTAGTAALGAILALAAAMLGRRRRG